MDRKTQSIILDSLTPRLTPQGRSNKTYFKCFLNLNRNTRSMRMQGAELMDEQTDRKCSNLPQSSNKVFFLEHRQICVAKSGQESGTTDAGRPTADQGYLTPVALWHVGGGWETRVSNLGDSHLLKYLRIIWHKFISRSIIITCIIFVVVDITVITIIGLQRFYEKQALWKKGLCRGGDEEGVFMSTNCHGNPSKPSHWVVPSTNFWTHFRPLT